MIGTVLIRPRIVHSEYNPEEKEIDFQRAYSLTSDFCAILNNCSADWIWNPMSAVHLYDIKNLCLKGAIRTSVEKPWRFLNPCYWFPCRLKRKKERRITVEFNCFANTWSVSRSGTNDKDWVSDASRACYVIWATMIGTWNCPFFWPLVLCCVKVSFACLFFSHDRFSFVSECLHFPRQTISFL